MRPISRPLGKLYRSLGHGPSGFSPHSRNFRKILGLLILGFVHAVLFTATGLLASRLTTLGNEVLVRSTNCGQWSLGIIAHSSDLKRLEVVL
jgi:hypothetical protein